MKEEIFNLFKEVLEKWINAEETVINDRGDISDYEELENDEHEYINRINKLLDEIK
ncbi:MAG: hypothetical protein E7C49_00215 [Clostridium sp.]|nr:hypothetical protein [Clostridium sp.]